MKKIIILVICILSLVSGTALANIDKTITNNNCINFSNQYQYQINNTKTMNISLSRYGFFDNMLGIMKTVTLHDLTLCLMSTSLNNSPEAFTSKEVPFFIIFNKEVESKLTFKTKSISNNIISYEVDNKKLRPLITAERVNLVVPLKNGPTQTIEIPEEILKEWRFIITCNLLDEYRKGI